MFRLLVFLVLEYNIEVQPLPVRSYRTGVWSFLVSAMRVKVRNHVITICKINSCNYWSPSPLTTTSYHFTCTYTATDLRFQVATPNPNLANLSCKITRSLCAPAPCCSNNAKPVQCARHCDHRASSNISSHGDTSYSHYYFALLTASLNYSSNSQNIVTVYYNLHN